ncbi:hypothetical protein [Aeromicrobium sp. Root495]|uniref:hypothetical protein n=1 Tax=Aeromicrobium sp. Root495 TaxID=1736550 RepID=UPI0012E7A67C|nr:hypothetical protein [Aeromicrobium sp. Root495]
MKLTEDEPGLNDDDALSLWVGRVARTHALLEYGVANVHHLLVRPGDDSPPANSAKSFSQLVSECRKRVSGSDAYLEIREPGVGALDGARDAGLARNRVVHDMWLPDPRGDDSGPQGWNTYRRLGDHPAPYSSAALQGLTHVIDAHTLLVRTRVRVSGLFMALYALSPPEGTRQKSPKGSVQDRYIALMNDRFTLSPNGDYNVA